MLQCYGVVVAQVLGRPQRKWLEDTLDAVQEAPVKLIVSGSVVFGSPLSNDTDGPCSGKLSRHLLALGQEPFAKGNTHNLPTSWGDVQ